MNAVLVPDREKVALRKPRSLSALRSADELTCLHAATTFRIQFISAARHRAPATPTEVEIQASNVSAAIVAAANIAWPPRTIGLRILDNEGREVFARQKADRR